MSDLSDVVAGSVHTADDVGNPMFASLAESESERPERLWCSSQCTATHAGCGGQCRLPQDGHSWHNCEKCNEGFV